MLIYIIAFVCYLFFMATKKQALGRFAYGVILTGFFIHLMGLLLRWWESHTTGYGYIPLSNMYESLVFFSWAIVVVYLIVDIRYHQRNIGVIAAPLAAITIAVTSLVRGVKSDISPLMPALQSNWLAIHVITCFLGYAAFAIAFGISIAYIIQSKRGSSPRGPISWLPSLQTLDEINYKAIVIGFPMLTLGIITGAAWASYAWGSYWSWDPKETWSLITWFIYAAFLHARYTHEWRGKKTALLSIIGFCAVIFTYFGVNFLLSGLHSYL
ncbi:MAG: c-type cytochrome biogenesis protein CcsB [Deltaproteobacteria bacterium RBG_13_52_11]|nr:MAG: c-type cytochrome biogenesis protein CcsB [Deltaproteobacteria bacterium RBG_13_52_11]